jgi:hypothetical protein
VTESCWLWEGYTDPAGYGHARVEGKVVAVHRAAYEAVKGPIPPDLEIDHLCRVRNCYNPAHLEAVTHAENVRRGRGGEHWAAKTHCPQGHPYEGYNLYINKHGGRVCRTCKNAAHRAHTRRTKELQDA